MQPNPTPKTLAAITGWEEDRRRALLLLQSLEAQARRRVDSATRWALAAAAADVQTALRTRAGQDIAEGVEMRWAHIALPAKVAA